MRLGIWQHRDTIAYEASCKACDGGFEFVDTANVHGNQNGVGQAIRDGWTQSRDMLFVMMKIFGGMNTDVDFRPGDWADTSERTHLARRQGEWLTLDSIHTQGETRSLCMSHYCSHHIDDIFEVKHPFHQIGTPCFFT